jgi:hypothetical protein
MSQNPPLHWMIRQLLANPTIVEACGDRVFSSHPWLNPPSAFPCIALDRDEGFSDFSIPVAAFPVMLLVYSAVSLDEAWMVMNAASATLHSTTGAEGTTRWVVRGSTTPIEDLDELPERVYVVAREFFVQQIG